MRSKTAAALAATFLLNTAVTSSALADAPPPQIGGTYATAGYNPQASQYGPGGNHYVSLSSLITGAAPYGSVTVCIALTTRPGRWCAASSYWWKNWWTTTFPVDADGAGVLYYSVFAHSGAIPGYGAQTTSIRSGWATIAPVTTLG